MAKFYKAVLKPFNTDQEVLDDVYSHLEAKDVPTMEERLGDAECPNCPDEGVEKTQTRWMLLPDESVAVTQGGKAYIECLDCGYNTHL